MAWRLSRYQDFIANITTITADFLNAVQDAIVDVYNGARTLKKAHVDVTGDQASSYGSEVFHVTGNTKLEGNANVTIDLSVGGATTSGGSVTSTAGDVVAAGGVVRAAGSNSGTGNVKAEGSHAGDGYLQASGTRSSATAGSGQSLTVGQVFKDSALVAWARVTLNGTPACVLDRGVNIASVTRNSVGNYTVTLVNGTANYLAPLVTLLDDCGRGTYTVAKAGITTSSFTILTRDIPDEPGSPVSTDFEFFVAVFGG